MFNKGVAAVKAQADAEIALLEYKAAEQRRIVCDQLLQEAELAI